MRSRLTSALRISLVPFVLLVAATPDRISLSGPLPSCRKGEFLTMINGQPWCRDLVGRTGQVPMDCGGQLLTAIPPSEKSWTCTPRGSIDADKVAALPELLSRARALELSVESQRDRSSVKKLGFVGTTALKTTGLISRAGTEPGMLSANALCNDEFPGAHFCSGYELHASVIAKLITNTNGMARSWVYHPSWKTPNGPAQNAEEGLADNCAGYTYGADDRGWSGIAAEFEVSSSYMYGADKVLAFRGGPLALCSSSLPLACCK